MGVLENESQTVAAFFHKSLTLGSCRPNILYLCSSEVKNAAPRYSRGTSMGLNLRRTQGERTKSYEKSSVAQVLQTRWTAENSPGENASHSAGKRMAAGISSGCSNVRELEARNALGI